MCAIPKCTCGCVTRVDGTVRQTKCPHVTSHVLFTGSARPLILGHVDFLVQTEAPFAWPKSPGDSKILTSNEQKRCLRGRCFRSPRTTPPPRFPIPSSSRRRRCRRLGVLNTSDTWFDQFMLNGFGCFGWISSCSPVCMRRDAMGRIALPTTNPFRKNLPQLIGPNPSLKNMLPNQLGSFLATPKRVLRMKILFSPEWWWGPGGLGWSNWNSGHRCLTLVGSFQMCSAVFGIGSHH